MPAQLPLAERVGFRVPATLMTNDAARLRAFFERQQGPIIPAVRCFSIRPVEGAGGWGSPRSGVGAPPGYTAVVRMLQRLDHSGALLLNRWPRRVGLARWLIGHLATGGAAAEVALMLTMALQGHLKGAMRMVTAVALVYGGTELLGRVYHRPRPFARLRGVEVFLPHGEERSFPSRHVASAFAMAGIAAHSGEPQASMMRAVAWLLAVSRVAAGLHYPSDAAAGIALGALIGRVVPAATAAGRR